MKEFFTKTALPYVLTAAMMSAALPAMAGDSITYDKRFEKNCQMKPTEFCQGAAQTLSKRPNWLPVVAHGGNETLFNSAKKVVRQLNNEGIRAYLLHAPEDDKIDITMNVDFYANGGTQYFAQVFDNDNITLKEVEDGLYTQAKKAYEAEYGSVASVVTSNTESTVAKVDASSTTKTDATLALR